MSIGWVISSHGSATVTTLQGLESITRALQPTNTTIQLEGTVLWSSRSDGRVILQDETSTRMLELQLSGRIPDQGEGLRFEGECAAVKARDAVKLSSVPLVENNGLHPLLEQSGSIYLEAGRHPVEVVWFNRTDRYGLEVTYEGPGKERRPIPPIHLFRKEYDPDIGKTNFVSGLLYHCFEGQWWRSLPNFNHMTPVRSSVVRDFDIGVRTRDNHVGLQFKGYLNILNAGEYRFHVKSDDGSRLFIGPPTLKATITEGGSLPVAASDVLQSLAADAPEFQWLELEGDVQAILRSEESLELELMTALGTVSVKVADHSGAVAGLKRHQKVRLQGVARRILNLSGNWVPGEFYVQSLEKALIREDAETEFADEELPLLTSIEQIYQLGQEEASRNYPVRVRGVITSPMKENGAVLQDSSRGIYMVLRGPINLQVGDYCEIEGITGPFQFSQYIDATNAVILGAGNLPEPVEPSWDQLINGSLHCNYVELEGVITAMSADTLSLLTRNGRINVRLNPEGAPVPPNAVGATIRLRGCLLADWDGDTKRVMVGSIYMDQQLISIVEPAPADSFSVGYKTVWDLLQFDPQAGALQRVRVFGKLIHKGREISCLMDGNNGLRFMPVNGWDTEVGDEVDVSGFLELGGASPVLREAITRKTRHIGLPEPNRLEPDALLRDELDATLVQVEGLLLGVSDKPGRMVLELQNGLRRFEAELSGEFERPDLTPGSLLDLTGAYIGLGGNRVLGRPFDSFKLLLNSDADITVLSRPPWWTLRRMLTLVGLLAAVLVAAAVWIKLLRRTVDERTVELGDQIRERQHAEHSREIEQERARVAQDLHDDLGAHLTEINMLASLIGNPKNSTDARSKYADQMKSIALHMVTSLDEIVWAVNPRNDKVSSLAGYFGAYAQRVLELASVKCGLDVGEKLPHLSLDPRFRREIFLAFKEALANVIQHAEATKVWLRIFVESNDLVVMVSDDGAGFISGEREAGADGLVNMKERLAALDGKCTIESEPGKGTIVRLQAPIQGTVGRSQAGGAAALENGDGVSVL